MNETSETIREVVGIFDDVNSMQEAISELEVSGFERRHISVLGNENALQEHFGKAELPTELLEDNPQTPRAANIKLEELGIGQSMLVSGGLLTGVVGAVIASGGLVIPGATVTTAVIGAAGGTAAGAGLAKLLGDKYAEFFHKQIEEGGLLVWVNTPDTEHESKAQAVLRKYGARDVHTHEFTYHQDGSPDETLNPTLFSDAFVQLEGIKDTYQRLMLDDHTLNGRIDDVLTSIKDLAAASDAVATEAGQRIASELTNLSIYAKDMAEEEQRMVAESHDAGAGSEEEEALDYFALANDLQSLSATFRRQIMHLVT